MTDQTVLITGATDGLGKAIAKELAKQGYILLLHGRDPKRGEALIKELKMHTAAKRLYYYNADFLDLKQIHEVTDQIQQQHRHLDILINNAGLGIEDRRRESLDGNEALWQVNYLASYLLIRRLRPLLANSHNAHIINVASAGQTSINFDDINQQQQWSGSQGYCQSKLAQIMMTMAMKDDYWRSGIRINSLHPASMMPTKIVRSTIDTLSDGVASVINLMQNPALSKLSGQYFFKQQAERAHQQAYDKEAQRLLLEYSEIMTGV